MTKAKAILCFDPQRRPANAVLQKSIAALIDHLETEERRLGLRLRDRRVEDQRNFRKAVEALVCNLLIAAMTSPKATLSVPRGHNSIWGKGRYRDPIYGQHFLSLIDLLCEVGFIKKVTHGYRFSKSVRQPTTIRPTPVFKKRMQITRLGPTDFQQVDVLEPIILKPPKDHEGRAEPIDYKETKRTAQWRREVQRLNTSLRNAAIDIAVENPKAFILDEDGQPIELYRRNLRRIFNNADWQQGGRLFGGFWMTMERAARFRTLRVMDEPVVNVDFSSLFPRLAYVRAGEAQPEGDLYDVMGDGACRDGWKQLINALLFAQRPLKQWPRDARENLPAGMPLRETITAIKFKHAPIGHLFECGIGFHLMRIESDILIAVVTALFKRGITALPLHDSVLVARSHGEAAKKVMEEAFRQHTGSARATVKIDFGLI